MNFIGLLPVRTRERLVQFILIRNGGDCDELCKVTDYQCEMAGRCCKSHDRLLIKRLKGTGSPWISSAMRVASWTRSC